MPWKPFRLGTPGAEPRACSSIACWVKSEPLARGFPTPVLLISHLPSLLMFPEGSVVCVVALGCLHERGWRGRAAFMSWSPLPLSQAYPSPSLRPAAWSVPLLGVVTRVTGGPQEGRGTPAGVVQGHEHVP